MNVMTPPRIRRSLGLVSLTLVAGGCGDSPVTVEVVDTAGKPPSIRTIESLYDIESTVTLEGPVQAVVTPPNANSMLAIAAEDPAEDQDGKLLIWAVESNTDALRFARRTGAIIPGSRLTVTAYLPKPEADLSVALTNAPRLTINRVVHGADAVFPDGTSVVLGELP